MRIDAHHHLWDLTVRDQPWTAQLPVLRRSFDFDQLRPVLAANDVDASVLVQTVCVAAETAEMLAVAKAEPIVAAVVGWVDLTSPDASDQLAARREGPGGQFLVGIRHQVQEEPDPQWLCRDDVRRGLAAVGQADLAYDLLVKPQQLAGVIDTVRALPYVRFILDHGGKPAIGDGAFELWARDIAQLAQSPNVAVKLSGLVTEAGPGWKLEQLRPYADHLLDCFGSARVMFGSDWPVCLQAASYDQVIGAATEFTAQLSAAEQDEAFGGTATRWYGLDA